MKNKASLNLVCANLVSATLLLTAVSGCAPHAGPDKTAEGTVLGAGWGTGVGAVVGNQVATAGMGAAVGAGFGAVAGLMTGAAFDQLEANMVEQRRILNDLQERTDINFQTLRALQDNLDNKIATQHTTGVYQVFFDHDSTQLKAGAIANLQTIAESMKGSLGANTIYVVGHTDDSGNKEHNKNLADARAREVTAYLSSRGISIDQIKQTSFAADRPLASNVTPEGRQLNRRVDVFLGASGGEQPK